MAVRVDDQIFITNSTVPIDGAIQEVTDAVDAKQTDLQVQEAGVNVGIPGYVETLNFATGATVTDMGSHVIKVDIAGGVTDFTGLSDVPHSYTGQANKLVSVNAGESALEFIAPPAGTGTVTSVSVTTANGVSGSVATATTTPAISLTLGAITPSSVVSSGSVTGTNLSGTNTGDNATNTQYSGLAASKQDVLVSGTNIKTINSTSLLGSGDIAISGSGLTQPQVMARNLGC